MKAMAFPIMLALTLSACAPATAAVPSSVPAIEVRAENFSFNWKYYPCSGNPKFVFDPEERNLSMPEYVVDTSTGTLVYTALGETNSISIPFRLTEIEAEAIYRKAVGIGFFDYPSTFVVPEPFVRGLMTPASAYELSMTNGGLAKSLIWSDHAIVEPPYAPADRLRELMDLIEKTVESHPEVQQLPPPTVQCA